MAEASARERCCGMREVGFGPGGVRVHDVARYQEAAVRVVAYPIRNEASSRSSRTRFGSTRSPKMRLARASTSGHFTRLALPLDGTALLSSRVRIAKNSFSRSRADSALIRFSS